MKEQNSIDLIDINKKKGFPRKYRFSAFTRWFTMLLAILVIAYALWYIFTAIDADASTFKKVVPFIILFLGINSLFRNLFSLNVIEFQEDKIIFKYILARSIAIRWEQIRKISVYTGKTRNLVMEYEAGDEIKKFMFTMIFPNMLEIVNAIAELCPQTEYDELVKTLIISKPVNTV